MINSVLPLGKLPPALLSQLLSGAPLHDPRVIFGPGIGLDCAVVELEAAYLVFKSDPITFVTDDIGWYVVQINTNDIATTGGSPKWLLVTLLLPEGKTTPESVSSIFQQLYNACDDIGVSVIGGHTEITHGLDRPIAVGTMIGEVAKDKLVTPKGITPGDLIMVTKGIPIEATAILAAEFASQLSDVLSADEIREAAGYLHKPGISVFKDAQLACRAGVVTGMHDPTEGGLAAALWELAEASRFTFDVDLSKIPISSLSERICRKFKLNPLNSIASGALLLTARPESGDDIQNALAEAGIPCTVIGRVVEGSVNVRQSNSKAPLPRPQRDDIALLYESIS